MVFQVACELQIKHVIINPRLESVLKSIQEEVMLLINLCQISVPNSNTKVGSMTKVNANGDYGDII